MTINTHSIKISTGKRKSPYFHREVNKAIPMEIFKKVNGFENLYEISNKGNLLSKRTGRIMKYSHASEYKYPYINLRKNGKSYGRYIHRLVADHFIPNPKNKPQVNHIDENKENNSIDNLEWCTPKENANHGTRNIRVALKTKIPIVQLTKDGEIVKVWDSKADARNAGFNEGQIYRCTHGIAKHHKGFKWEYYKRK